jgi:hypothetical protein
MCVFFEALTECLTGATPAVLEGPLMGLGVSPSGAGVVP